MSHDVDNHTSVRGLNWFNALTTHCRKVSEYADSVLVADGQFNQQAVRVIAVVPHTQNLYPRARHGEVGVLEGWSLAKAVDDVIQQDRELESKRAIICVVDVPSQAYGRREEVLGIYLALAGAVDSYARARLAKHPVISLLVGKSMSGAFLAHGYQANRIFALNDQGVMVHAMGKESAARVTLRSVDELEKLAASIPPMAYDIESYSSLGLLTDILTVSHPVQPTELDVAQVQQRIEQAISEVQELGSVGLENRLHGINRQASKQVRDRLAAEW